MSNATWIAVTTIAGVAVGSGGAVGGWGGGGAGTGVAVGGTRVAVADGAGWWGRSCHCHLHLLGGHHIGVVGANECHAGVGRGGAEGC